MDLTSHYRPCPVYPKMSAIFLKSAFLTFFHDVSSMFEVTASIQLFLKLKGKVTTYPANNVKMSKYDSKVHQTGATVVAVSISASASAPNRLDKRDGYTIINNLQPFGGFKKSLDSCTLSTEDIKDFNTLNVLFQTRFFLVFAYCLREIVIAKIY